MSGNVVRRRVTNGYEADVTSHIRKALKLKAGDARYGKRMINRRERREGQREAFAQADD